mmetsp:Transcript_40822/g.73716  ORF Transcript_40822/g.73716 Transcript_40822/m.73716 type:complete len:186 (+) Transcript_40822:75-632(+)
MLRTVAAVVFTSIRLHVAAANSLHMAGLCPDQWCEDPYFPLLDFEDGNCICKKHPCWNDNGLRHFCREEGYPYLHYMYEETGELRCQCSSIPHYDSPYIVRDLCAGQDCDQSDYPVLDLDKDGAQCVCNRHPCASAGGVQHRCEKADFPILRYRLDENRNPVCECVAKLEEPDGPMGIHARGVDM